VLHMYGRLVALMLFGCLRMFLSFLFSLRRLTFLLILSIRQGDKLLGAAGRNSDILFIDKKEVQQLLKIVRGQTFS
jgi:hypothetical protein